MPLAGRAAFRLLLPALALPLYGIGWGFQVSGSDSGLGYQQSAAALAFAVFMYVLLFSMTLNAWLLLRRPVYWRAKSLPASVGRAQLALYATVTVWHLQLALAFDAPVTWFFIVATMVLSIVVFVALILARPPVKERFANVEFSNRTRFLLRLYIPVAVLALVGTAAAFAFATQTGELPWWLIPAPIAVSLPWTLVLPIIGVVIGPLLSVVPPLGFAVGVLELGVNYGLNFVIVLRLLGSPERATATMNRIFLLGKGPANVTVARPTPEWPAQKEAPPWEAEGAGSPPTKD